MPEHFEKELKELMKAFEKCDNFYPEPIDESLEPERTYFKRARKLINDSSSPTHTWWLLFIAHLGDGFYEPDTDEWVSSKWKKNAPYSETINDLFYNFSYEVCPPPCIETYRAMMEAWKRRTTWRR